MGRIATTLLALTVALAACGDDDGGAVPDARVNNNFDASVSIDAAAPDAATPDAALPDAFVADAVPPDGRTCPNVVGQYNILNVTGSCGNLDSFASQFIAAGTGICVVDFTSTPAKGNPGVVATGVQLDSLGRFENETLTLGTIAVADCDGTWNDGTSTMSINCGSGACTLDLSMGS